MRLNGTAVLGTDRYACKRDKRRSMTDAEARLLESSKAELQWNGSFTDAVARVADCRKLEGVKQICRAIIDLSTGDKY